MLNIVSTWAQWRILHATITGLSPAYLILAGGVLLAVFKDRRLHAVGLIAFIALYTALFFNRSLG